MDDADAHMWKIKKEPEKERIVVTVSGDEIIGILPDRLLELINREEEEEMEGEFKREMDSFEKGIFKLYLPIKTTRPNSSLEVDNTLNKDINNYG